jgi:hypothetical protein
MPENTDLCNIIQLTLSPYDKHTFCFTFNPIYPGPIVSFCFIPYLLLTTFLDHRSQPQCAFWQCARHFVDCLVSSSILPLSTL